jgi:hypothetical protein
MRSQLPAAWVLPALLLASACSAPPDQSIIVTVARAPGQACDFSDSTLYVESGALDLSVLPIYQSYYQVFSWENDLENISVTVNSQITTDTPNTFVATTIKDSYVLVGGVSPPSGLVSISATIAPGATPTSNSVGVFLLTADAVAAICGAPTALDNCPGFTSTGTETLLVTFQIAGALVGGGAAQTNPITFPLQLFKGGHVKPDGTCATGYMAQTTTCGIPGRDIPYCVPQ